MVEAGGFNPPAFMRLGGNVRQYVPFIYPPLDIEKVAVEGDVLEFIGPSVCESYEEALADLADELESCASDGLPVSGYIATLDRRGVVLRLDEYGWE